jgi:hypothetical protein
MVVTRVAATIGDAVTFTRSHPTRDPGPHYATTSPRKRGAAGGKTLRLVVVKLGMQSNAAPSWPRQRLRARCRAGEFAGGIR